MLVMGSRGLISWRPSQQGFSHCDHVMELECVELRLLRLFCQQFILTKEIIPETNRRDSATCLRHERPGIIKVFTQGGVICKQYNDRSISGLQGFLFQGTPGSPATSIQRRRVVFNQFQYPGDFRTAKKRSSLSCNLIKFISKI